MPHRQKSCCRFAHGSESLETITLVNLLRRAEIEVTVASIERDLAVNGTRAIKLVADKRFFDASDEKYDLIVLPGGEKVRPHFPSKLSRARTKKPALSGLCRTA